MCHSTGGQVCQSGCLHEFLLNPPLPHSPPPSTHTYLTAGRVAEEPARLRCVTAQVGRSVRVAVYMNSCSTTTPLIPPPTHIPDSRQSGGGASQVKVCHSTGGQVCQSLDGCVHVFLCWAGPGQVHNLQTVAPLYNAHIITVWHHCTKHTLLPSDCATTEQCTHYCL